MIITNILIPMAGLGSRFYKAGYKQPKPLVDVLGKPMIQRVVENLEHPNLNFIFCVAKKHTYDYNIVSLLKNIKPDCTIIIVDKLTEGSACTCLLAEKFIDNSTPLIITNSDQIILDWDFEKFNDYCEGMKADGVLGVFHSDSPKNSYAKIDSEGRVVETKEKQVISELATNGIHYWSEGRYFVNSAKMMIENNDRTNNEFYVAPTYNYMIKAGLKVYTYHFIEHFPIGTPEDLKVYIDKVLTIY